MAGPVRFSKPSAARSQDWKRRRKNEDVAHGARVTAHFTNVAIAGVDGEQTAYFRRRSEPLSAIRSPHALPAEIG
jgi:hypothetical protein